MGIGGVTDRDVVTAAAGVGVEADRGVLGAEAAGVGEAAAVVIVSMYFAVWLYRYNGARLFDVERSSDNIAVAAALVALFGTLLGFIIAAITFLFGIVDKDAFRVLRSSNSYADHWGIFQGCLRACAVSTLFSVME